jgi:uncharacterized protein (UPF0333 family)
MPKGKKNPPKNPAPMKELSTESSTETKVLDAPAATVVEEPWNDLPDKVTIRQVNTSDWLEVGHDGHDRYTNTAEYLTPQNRRGTRELITGLTPKLEARLEALLNLPGRSAVMPQGTLSKYNLDFWSTFRVEIPKGGKTLYLSDPRQELEYHVLLAHQRVAGSREELRTNAFAHYVISSEEEEASEVNRTISAKGQAFAKFRAMHQATMRGYLRVYNRLNNSQTKISENSSISYIEAAVGTIVDEQPEKFLEVIDNEDYKILLFIDDCIEARVIRQERTKYLLQGGDLLGTTLETTIDYLKDINNQDVYITLKSQVEANR